MRLGRGLRCCSSHPEGSSLAQLKHPVHTVLELDSAVELGQVVVINPQQLECEGGWGDRKGSSGRERWESGEKKGLSLNINGDTNTHNGRNHQDKIIILVRERRFMHGSTLQHCFLFSLYSTNYIYRNNVIYKCTHFDKLINLLILFLFSN